MRVVAILGSAVTIDFRNASICSLTYEDYSHSVKFFSFFLAIKRTLNVRKMFHLIGANLHVNTNAYKVSI